MYRAGSRKQSKSARGEGASALGPELDFGVGAGYFEAGDRGRETGDRGQGTGDGRREAGGGEAG